MRQRIEKKSVAGIGIILFIMTVLLFGGAVTKVQNVSAKTKVKVKKVSVTSPTGKKAYVAKGKKISLSTAVTVTPNKDLNKAVTYRSSNRRIATVTSEGIVKGKRAGTAKITVTSQKNRKKKATIKIVVKNKAVSSIRFSEKKPSLILGKKKTLKVKISPSKNVCKLIRFKSSKSSIVSVTQKGVVTAKKAGSATITAYALDGSKKKGTCRVFVSAPEVPATNIKSVTVINDRTVIFTLDQKTVLTKNEVSVKKKGSVGGAYQNDLTVESMTSSDSMNYTITLHHKSLLELYDYVQVTIPSLSGTKTAEGQYKEEAATYTKEEISSWTVDTYGEDSFAFHGAGYSTYEVTGLPEGLSASTDGDNGLVVKGRPTKAGVTPATMKATDEQGNVLTETIYFLVGSAQQLVGAGLPVYAVEAEDAVTLNVSAVFRFSGGSGSYQYKIKEDGGIGAKLLEETEDKLSDCRVEANVKKAGSYTVVLEAADLSDPSLTAEISIPVSVAATITIKGTVKDAGGEGMPYDTIVFKNKDRADRYMAYKQISTVQFQEESVKATLNEKKKLSSGQYEIRIVAGTYDVEAAYQTDRDFNGEQTTLYGQNFTESKDGIDLSLPLYKIALTGATEDIRPSEYSWGVQNGEPVTVYEKAVQTENYDYTAFAYLKSGSYTLQTENFYENVQRLFSDNSALNWFLGYTETMTGDSYCCSANFIVLSKSVSIPVTKTVVQTSGTISKVVYQGVKNTEKVVNIDEEVSISYGRAAYGYQFLPAETGKYMITNDNVHFYKNDGTEVEVGEDSTYQLTQGETYFAACGKKILDQDVQFMIKKYSGIGK